MATATGPPAVYILTVLRTRIRIVSATLIVAFAGIRSHEKGSQERLLQRCAGMKFFGADEVRYSATPTAQAVSQAPLINHLTTLLVLS
jgi:hypothetical protein